MRSTKNHENLLSEVATYYTDKVTDFGATAQGVDWNSTSSQQLRFEQLCKVIEADDAFSINDLGCGYGALLDYLLELNAQFKYSGFDVSEQMIKTARDRYQHFNQVRFEVLAIPDDIADFGIASGIFNVRLRHTDDEWLHYIEDTLNVLHESSRSGFAFNCLTSYSDTEKMQTHLYYTDPCYLFNLCKQRYSRNVALLHDYNLYEFTILVRKLVNV